MTTSPATTFETKPLKPEPKPQAPRQAWLLPAIVAVAAYWIGRLIVTVFLPATFTQFMYLFYAPMVVGLVLLIWLLFLSRLTWTDRGWSLLAIVGGGIAATLVAERSMMFGMLLYALPVAATTLVAWHLVTSSRATWPNRLALAAAVLAAWGYYTLLRMDGIDGALAPHFSWRWDETAEARFLASLPKPTGDKAIEVVPSDHDWPAFRGRNRDGVVHGIKLVADWEAQPPRELWRRRVGPNWSSIAVVGNYGFTQEQRGENEAVVCFDIRSGEEIWAHQEKARFEEVVAGAGPRATPTFHAGKLYAQGASGLLTCLDASTGKLLWKRDVASEANSKPPQWGFSASPLIAGNVVIAYAGGKDGKTLLAYDAESGQPRWSGGAGTHSYSSPQLWKSGDQEQALFLSDHGLQALDAATGKLLWEHEWMLNGMFRVVQPLVTQDAGILLGTGMGHGTRQLLVEPASDGKWTVEEGWTTKDMKPYFNDFVEYEGNLYGFDNEIFASVDLETGKRNWKKGRYGAGQVLLVADSGHLLVITENSGELVLLEATPDEHVELGKLKVLPGKTWNHPVLIGDKLLLRNGEEMACYELATEPTTDDPATDDPATNQPTTDDPEPAAEPAEPAAEPAPPA